jgi:cold shock CspA family protein
VTRHYLLLIPLLIFATVTAAGEQQIPKHLLPLVSITITHNGHFEEYPATFEFEAMCKDFILSPAEIRAFFNKAHFIPRQNKKLDAYRADSRCQVQGRATLQDGQFIEFEISRTGYAIMRYGSFKTSTDWADYFCKTCGSKFYPAMGKTLSGFRPIIKSIVIKDNGVSNEDIDPDGKFNPDTCKNFKLTENEVKEFFITAGPSTPGEFHGTDSLGICFSRGEAVMQNGEKASWYIDANRRGTINYLKKTSGDRFLRFFCDECPTGKFAEPCSDEKGDCG